MSDVDQERQKRETAERILKHTEREIEDIEKRWYKSRKHLYWAGTVCIAIKLTDAIPEKIESLGITFSQFQQRRGLLLLSAVVAYFLVEFILLTWSSRVASKLIAAAEELLGEEYLRHFDQHANRLMKWTARLHFFVHNWIITAFDTLLPIAAAIFAILLVLWPEVWPWH